MSGDMTYDPLNDISVSFSKIWTALIYWIYCISFLWVWNLVSHTDRRTNTDRIENRI